MWAGGWVTGKYKRDGGRGKGGRGHQRSGARARCAVGAKQAKGQFVVVGSGGGRWWQCLHPSALYGPPGSPRWGRRIPLTAPATACLMPAGSSTPHQQQRLSSLAAVDLSTLNWHCKLSSLEPSTCAPAPRLPLAAPAPQETFALSGCLKWGYPRSLRVLTLELEQWSDLLALDLSADLFSFLYARDVNGRPASLLTNYGAKPPTTNAGCQCLESWTQGGVTYRVGGGDRWGGRWEAGGGRAECRAQVCRCWRHAQSGI